MSRRFRPVRGVCPRCTTFFSKWFSLFCLGKKSLKLDGSNDDVYRVDFAKSEKIERQAEYNFCNAGGGVVGKRHSSVLLHCYRNKFAQQSCSESRRRLLKIKTSRRTFQWTFWDGVLRRNALPLQVISCIFITTSI